MFSLFLFRRLEKQSNCRAVPRHFPPSEGPLWCLTKWVRQRGSTRWNCVPISCRHALCFNGRGRAPVPLCKHFCSHMWPQLPAHPLWWSCGQCPCLHFKVCCQKNSEITVLWGVPCKPRHSSCILIFWPELPPAWTLKQWWADDPLRGNSEGGQSSRACDSTKL